MASFSITRREATLSSRVNVPWQILSDARVRIDGGEGREILVSPRPQEETGCSKARDRSAHVESQPWQHPPGDGV
jgi:hypothetical protein